MKSIPLYPFTYEADLEKNKGYYWKKSPSYEEYIKLEMEKDGN